MNKLLLSLIFLGGGALLALLTLLNLLVVYLFSGQAEVTLHFTWQNIWQNPALIFFLAFLLAIFLCLDKLSTKFLSIAQLKKICLYYFTAITLLVYLIFPFIPRSDGAVVQNLALAPKTALSNNYLFLYPNNLGYFFESLISGLLFNGQNLGIILLFNLPGTLMLVFAIFKITELLFKNEKITRISIILLSTCVPLFFLTNFYYNDCFAMGLIMLAIYISMKLTKTLNYKRYLPLLIFLTTFACFIRENTIVLTLGIFIMMIFSIKRDIKGKNEDNTTNKARNATKTFMIISKRILSAFLILLIPLLFMFTITKVFNKAGEYYASKHLEVQHPHEINELTVPASSFISMSIMPLRPNYYDESSPHTKLVNSLEDKYKPLDVLYTGWWNAFNIRCTLKFGAKECDEYSKRYIKDEVHYFLNHPKVAAKFYFQKIASQWAEPTYHYSRYLLNTSIDQNRNISTQKIRVELPMMLDTFSNAHHLLVLLFACIGFIFSRKLLSWQFILPIICIIGYFLFSILWEAKSRYVFIVFPLFIPYAAAGIMIVANKVKEIAKGVRKAAPTAFSKNLPMNSKNKTNQLPPQLTEDKGGIIDA